MSQISRTTLDSVPVSKSALKTRSLRTSAKLSQGTHALRNAIRVDLPRPSGEFNQFIDVIPDSALSRHRPTNGIRGAVDAAFGF